MITLQELYTHLDQKLEITAFKDYCPNGLQVEGLNEVRKVATAVTSSLKTIQEAVELGVDVLIVHHGLFWKGDPFPVTGTKREKLRLLIENNISLLAYHLPLDAHQELGNNWKAALDMGWKSLEPFGEMDGNFIGVKGSFSPISVENLQEQLEVYYQHPAHTACGGNQKVTTAALISGGAYRYATEAAKEGIDCFITGNFDEPAWHHAYEEGVNFFAMGHSATERVGPKVLAEYLYSTLGLKTLFLDVENPF